MNEDLIKIKIRKLELKVEESQEGFTEEFKRLFAFMCRHIERQEMRIRELEIKVEMNKHNASKNQKVKTLEKFRELHQKKIA